jgi:hypothetical protein
MYIYALLPLVRYHEANGESSFDADLTAEHIRELKERFGWSQTRILRF